MTHNIIEWYFKNPTFIFYKHMAKNQSLYVLEKPLNRHVLKNLAEAFPIKLN